MLDPRERRRQRKARRRKQSRLWHETHWCWDDGEYVHYGRYGRYDRLVTGEIKTRYGGKLSAYLAQRSRLSEYIATVDATLKRDWKSDFMAFGSVVMGVEPAPWQLDVAEKLTTSTLDDLNRMREQWGEVSEEVRARNAKDVTPPKPSKALTVVTPTAVDVPVRMRTSLYVDGLGRRHELSAPAGEDWGKLIAEAQAQIEDHILHAVVLRDVAPDGYVCTEDDLDAYAKNGYDPYRDARKPPRATNITGFSTDEFQTANDYRAELENRNRRELMAKKLTGRGRPMSYWLEDKRK